MNIMKITFLSCFFLTAYLNTFGQDGNIVGSWQLVKQGSCVEEAENSDEDAGADLRHEMGSSTSGQVVTFKDNSTGEELSRILSSSKTANAKKFYYKFNGEMLLILDKKSQTISDSYTVDKFTADSLIISNASRPCETRIFVKINQQQPN